ncbi:keratinocyte proline-rich protein-like [Belonocnema kinseyi]|uniref:keratinocyte proline-rich protein-like n=1 Tax=Belonocnema kinseyi TaxID=2817044 RepID=UPI00143DCE4A|nr:keratinocyte proline-rich protein-like [Belonocnema kinseyi]
MGHTREAAIALAFFVVTFTTAEIRPRVQKVEYIYDRDTNRKVGFVVTRVRPVESKSRNEIEQRSDLNFEKASVEPNPSASNTEVKRTTYDQDNNDYYQGNYPEDQQAVADNNQEVISHHLREDVVKTLTIVKQIPVPVPIEKTVHYPVIKNIPYMVKVPVPEPYPLERKIPYPVNVYVKTPVKIPEPVAVYKEVPYAVPVAVDRPVPVKVYIPYPIPVEKKVHYEVKVPVPQPYPVERKIPIPVKVTEHVIQPYPQEKVVPYPVKIEVQRPVPVPVLKPYPVPVPVSGYDHGSSDSRYHASQGYANLYEYSDNNG